MILIYEMQLIVTRSRDDRATQKRRPHVWDMWLRSETDLAIDNFWVPYCNLPVFVSHPVLLLSMNCVVLKTRNILRCDKCILV